MINIFFLNLYDKMFYVCAARHEIKHLKDCADLEKVSSMLLQSKGLMTPFFLLKHLNPPRDDLKNTFNFYPNLGGGSKQGNKWWPSDNFCQSDLMGLQL